MLAALAIETGIAPRMLMREDPAMLATMIKLLADRAEAHRRAAKQRRR